MDLNIFKKSNAASKEYYWSVVIGKNWVSAGIWTIVGENTEVIAQGGHFSWEQGSIESLVEAADSSLSASASSLPDDVQEPNKVVYGLPSSWVQVGQIKKDKLEVLKKLSHELELKPAGFVSMPEAITHLLKIEEGVPPNVILLGLTEDSVEVTLVVSGKVVGIEDVARSMSLGSDMEEGLMRMALPEPYPTRIMLYNHKTENLEDARQNILETDWEKTEIKFLHTPKVEILPEEASVAAVSLAGGSEVGQAKSLAFPIIKGSNKNLDFSHEAEKTPEEEQAEKPMVEEKDAEQDEDQNLPSKSDVGIIESNELGFLEGADIAERGHIQESLQEENHAEEQEKVSKKNFIATLTSLFTKIPLPSLALPRFHLPQGRGKLSILGIVMLFVLAGLATAYWFLPKAQVTVYVSPKKLAKTISFTVDGSATSVDIQNKVIPGRFLETSISGEKTTSTTGTKTIGDRARGSVTVYRVGDAVTFPKGTAIFSANSLKFSLDSDVQVASGSAVTPGTAQAPVTASSIGAEYNVTPNTAFTVGSLSENVVGAKNDAAFSGGTSRDVPAVSQKDKDDLEKALLSDLIKQAMDKLQAELTNGEILVQSDNAETAIDKKSFDHDVGEESETVNLSIAGKVKYLVIARDNLNKLISSQIEPDIPQGFAYLPEQTNISVTEGGNGQLNAQISANLLPKVNPDEITNELLGQTLKSAKDRLISIPGFTRVQIVTTFKLPGFLGTLPHLKKNISVEVSAEK